MTQVRHVVDPKPVRPELKNAAVFFFLDQRQSERVAIKRDRLLVGVARTFDRDVRSTGKLRPMKFSNHRSNLAAPCAAPSPDYSAPLPPGSVICIGSSPRSCSFSGSAFFSRPISQRPRPVLGL